MLIGAKEPYQQNTRSSHHAGTQLLPHKNRCVLDTGSLAGSARHCPRHSSYDCNLPHLEAQE